MNVTAVTFHCSHCLSTAARMLLLPAASRILPLPPLQECYRRRQYKNLSTSLLAGVHTQSSGSLAGIILFLLLFKRPEVFGLFVTCDDCDVLRGTADR